jgi:hypothetical protein
MGCVARKSVYRRQDSMILLANHRHSAGKTSLQQSSSRLVDQSLRYCAHITSSFPTAPLISIIYMSRIPFIPQASSSRPVLGPATLVCAECSVDIALLIMLKPPSIPFKFAP